MGQMFQNLHRSMTPAQHSRSDAMAANTSRR